MTKGDFYVNNRHIVLKNNMLLFDIVNLAIFQGGQ